jgi:hypothetical protein
MKIMKKILSSFAIVLLTAATLSAQHEFSIYGAAGSSYISYTLNAAAIPPGNGMVYSDGNSLQSGVGLGYTYSLTPQWGLVSGLEIKYFTTTVDINSLDDRTKELYSYDGRTEDMYFNSLLYGFNERQRVTRLQIPLLAEYRFFAIGDDFVWFVAAGAKLGFNLSGKYEATANRLTTTGYFPESEQTLQNMPEHGFADRNNLSWSDKLNDFGFNLSFTAETGARWPVTQRLGIYAGIYFDYGYASVPAKLETGIVNYQPDNRNTFAYNSILTSARQISGERFIDKINLVSIGVKLKIGWKTHAE